ncbi:MAG: amino acid dehydrogenase [Clostridia bacterium]|nr:amino acid dehydrogenase [Clostridia bacterium]
MGVFDLMAEHGHEQVAFCWQPDVGLKAIIAFHDTTMGPGLGGTRMRAYGSEEEALRDALRLSRGMTYKSAAADLDFGGAKCVIIGDPAKDKSPELFRALGRFVGGFGGRFYTGTDVGTYPEDFAQAARESGYFVGLPVEYGGSGDSSVPTAHGVHEGMKAAAQHLWGQPSLAGRTVAVQGVGKVGAKLARLLAADGTKLVLADLESGRARQLAAETGGTAVSAAEILEVECDIFSPCALGGVLNDETIPRLSCRAVVGSANNQLAEDRHGRMLMERGILYAPDYIVNAGGLIQVADELHPRGPNPERVIQRTRAIGETLTAIFRLAEALGIPTSEAADRIVAERLEKTFRLKRVRLGRGG